MVRKNLKTDFEVSPSSTINQYNKYYNTDTPSHYIDNPLCSINSDKTLLNHNPFLLYKIKVLSGKGWKFQEDDKLPVDLQPGSDVYIIRGIYHRLIKGVSDLIIRIKEI